MSSAELHMRSRLLLRVLCAAATIACLPLLLWSSGERGVAAAATPHHNKLRRRGLRQQKRQRWRRQWPHLALVDVDDFASLLGDDFDWAATSIPFLDLDTSVPGADALLRAYYFRWRVFSRHLRSTAGASADPHSSTQGGDLQCCSADASACSLVSAATGWCAGAKTEGECHGRRTESKPCVWSRASGRCAKGFPYGTSSSPSCPEPLAPSAAAAVITVPPPWVVTEFEADVPWAGAYNTISCAAGHHLMEGRWLRNRSYLDSYARFWLTSPAGASNARKYTFWVASAVYERSLVTGDASLLLELYPALQANYRAWVGSQLSHTHRCLWQYADRDGQENSIGGDGCRPLLQSVMYGEAMALAAIAELAGDASGAHRFRDEARRWQRALLSLWAPARAFFMTRAVARPASAPRHDWAEQQRRSSRALNQGRCPPEWREGELVSSRELQGLSSPWYFGAVPAEEAAQYAASWAPLFDPTSGFAAPWGPRTAERSDPCYNYSTAHESDWQAPSWPFETSKVITGALRFLHEYPPTAHRTRGAIDARQLWALLTQYARAHLEADAINASAWLLPGMGRAWIGEALHPDEGYWLVRRKLYAANHPTRNRGHRYLHSTFCDLLIGLLGVRPRGVNAKGRRVLTVRALVPAANLGMRYFALDGMRIAGHDVTIAYDEDGSRYGLSKSGVGLRGGLSILVDGELVVANAALGEAISVAL